MNIITRFAPSPTGLLHSGAYRTALFSYLYAHKHGGKFFLRIEDTDVARSTKENEANILESLEWIGLDYDNKGDVMRQSARTAVYRGYLEKMIASGAAYVSKEEPKTDPVTGVVTPPARAEVIRFKNPNVSVSFDDAIRGTITFDTADLKDFVLAKSLDEPLFHLTVVVDDFEMGVTHVIRGEDHISNTPRQMLIQDAIGAPHPVYAHLPLILAPDKTKLSKRKGAQSLTYYRDRGFLPEAMVNYLALLGWNPGTDQELFSLAELVATFDLSGIQKSGAMFNQEKFDWFNREYVKKLPAGVIEEKILDALVANHLQLEKSAAGTIAAKLVPFVLDRIVTLGDIAPLFATDGTGEFDFAAKAPEYPREKLLWKPASDAAKAKEYLTQALALIEAVPDTAEAWTADGIKAAIFDYATSVGRGEVLWPLRYSLTGKDKSPDPFATAALIGKEETVSRVKKAISIL